MSSFRFDLRNAGRRGRGAVGAALVLLGALGGIGGGCGGTPAPDYSEITSFCQALAQADCSQPVVQACYGASADSLPTDIQICTTRRASPEVCNPSNLPYHAEYAQPCIDAHTAAYGTGQLGEAAIQSMTQACLPVFNEAGELGAQCSADTDCDAGAMLSCVVHQGTTGSCQTPVTVAAGNSCAALSSECGTGYLCEATSQANGFFCVAQPTLNQPCSATNACGPGFRCASPGNVCADQLPDGSTCAVDTDCSGGLCITTSSGAVCAANYTFAVGAPTCTGFLPE